MNAPHRQPAVPLPDDEEPGDKRPAAHVASIDYLFGRADLDDATEIDAPEQAIRYERGSLVYAMDGPVGTLQQVVIDEEMAEVKALVVRVTARNESVLMPPDLVEKSVGDALMLNVTREQFAKGASRSPRFEARMFTGADAKTVSKVIPMVFRGDARRSVVSMSRDALATSDTRQPEVIPPASGALPRWRTLFTRR